MKGVLGIVSKVVQNTLPFAGLNVNELLQDTEIVIT